MENQRRCWCSFTIVLWTWMCMSIFYVCAQRHLQIFPCVRLLYACVCVCEWIYVSNTIMVDGSSMLIWLLATTSAYVWHFIQIVLCARAYVCVFRHLCVCKRKSISFCVYNSIGRNSLVWFDSHRMDVCSFHTGFSSVLFCRVSVCVKAPFTKIEQANCGKSAQACNAFPRNHTSRSLSLFGLFSRCLRVSGRRIQHLLSIGLAAANIVHTYTRIQSQTAYVFCTNEYKL